MKRSEMLSVKFNKPNGKFNANNAKECVSRFAWKPVEVVVWVLELVPVWALDVIPEK